MIEVIIAASILSIVALGITTLVEDMLRVQKKGSTVGVINNMRTVITSAVQNGRSWELTVADATGNPYMACFRGSATCTTNTVTSLKLRDIGNTVVYDSLTSAAHGFRFDGSLCTTYPSDECQLRWDLTWKATCPNAAATCYDPNVSVSGRLVYTPGTAGALPGGFNPELYRIDIIRGGDAIRNDAVTLSYVEADASGEGSGCETAWVNRKLNTVIADPAGNLINKIGATVSPADQVQLKAGTYNCRIQAPAFKNGGNRLQIISTAGTAFAPITSSVATASSNGGSANLLIETTLILNADTTFVIQQKCTSLPSSSG